MPRKKVKVEDLVPLEEAEIILVSEVEEKRRQVNVRLPEDVYLFLNSDIVHNKTDFIIEACREKMDNVQNTLHKIENLTRLVETVLSRVNDVSKEVSRRG